MNNPVVIARDRSPMPGVKFIKIPMDLRRQYDESIRFSLVRLLIREIARLRDALDRIVSLDVHYYADGVNGESYAGRDIGLDMHQEACVTCIAHEALRSRYDGESSYVYD